MGRRCPGLPSVAQIAHMRLEAFHLKPQRSAGGEIYDDNSCRGILRFEGDAQYVEHDFPVVLVET